MADSWLHGHGQGASDVTDHPDVAAVARKMRILLVEDNPDTAMIMSRLLESEGHSISTAGSMQDALQHADDPIDLLISDIGLPDGNGLDLMRIFCARKPVRGIALTGFGSREDIENSRAAGFDRHLTKPIDFQKLLNTIEQVAAS
ncbi:MAG: response regulator [Tepidisphaeraceae bacterium]